MRVFQRKLPHLPDPADAQPAASAADPQQYELQMELSMQQILTIGRFYWKKSMIIAAGLVVVLAVIIKLLPATYTATATLIVNSKRENPLPGQQFQGDDLASYVATQMELITSRVVLLPVIDKLELTKDDEFASGFHDDSAAALREFVEKKLANSVQVDQGRGGQLLYVSVSARDPAKATTIANAVAQVYLQLDRQRANDPVTEQAQRSSEELAELRAKVTAAQDNATAFRQRNGLTSLAAANDDTEMQALTNLETRLLEVQNQRRTLEAQQAGQIASGDEALASNHIGVLKDTLATLQAKLAQVQPTLGPKHPDVLALEAQIAATRRSLNTAVEALSSNLTTQLSREHQLEADLTQAAAAQRAKVLHLRQVQDEGAKLQLELQSAQSVYKLALDGFDQVKFAAVRDFANVSMVSPATPPVKPTKPNKLGLFGMAIIAALAVGFAVPFVYELFVDRRLRCRDDLERAFGIRVLAQIEPTPLLSSPV